MTFISDLIINNTALRIKTGEKLNKLYSHIGDKSQLVTSNKTTLVNAINEVKNTALPITDSRIANWDTSFDWGDHKNKYAKIALNGDSDGNSIMVKDSRTTPNEPSPTYRRGVFFDFKTNATLGLTKPGAGTFSSVITMVPYSDSSGWNNVTFRMAHNATGLNIQTWNNEWKPWKTIWDSENLKNLSQLTNDLLLDTKYLALNQTENASLASVSGQNINTPLSGNFEAYIQSSATNKPINTGGFLSQRKFTNTTESYLNQAYNSISSNRFFKRFNIDQPWVELYHTGNLTKVSQLQNDAGYSTTDTVYPEGILSNLLAATPTSNNRVWSAKVLNDWGANKFLSNSNLKSRSIGGNNTIDANTEFSEGTGGFITSYGSNTWLTNGAFSGYGGLLDFAHNSNSTLQLQFDNGHVTAKTRLAFRSKNNYGFTSWNEVYHTGNLTKLSQLDNDINFDNRYLKLGDNNLYNFKSISSDLNLQKDSIVYASSSANRPNDTNSTVLTLNGLDEYGFQVAARNEVLSFRGLENSIWKPWRNIWHSGNLINPATQTWVNAQGFKQMLALDSLHGGVSISNGNSIILNSLASKARTDSNVRELGQAFTPYLMSGGSVSSNYPVNANGVGIRMERFSVPTSQLGFDIHKAQNQDYLWYKTFDGENTESAWKILADRTWITSQNYLTTIPLATNTIIGGMKLANNAIQTVLPTAVSATAARSYAVQLNSNGHAVVNVPWSNTTYSAGTLALLNTGTDASNRVWPTKVLADYVTAKIAQGADSIWEHTPQGGIRIANYDSLATRSGTLAIGKGSGATKLNAIGIGTAANSDGNDGTVVGPLSTNLGTYGTVVGPYSVNTAMEGVVHGAFLQNNQRGCTVTGRYNDPILNYTANTINNKSPLFIIGNGRSASIRSNAYVMNSDGLGTFQNKQTYTGTITEFSGQEIPTAAWVLNQGGGSGGSTEDYISDYGSQIARIDLNRESHLQNAIGGASGEILTNQSINLSDAAGQIVCLQNDGTWEVANSTGNYETNNYHYGALIGLVLSNGKDVLLRGYFSPFKAELKEILWKATQSKSRFLGFNKGDTQLNAYGSTAISRVVGYALSDKVGYFNPWMGK